MAGNVQDERVRNLFLTDQTAAGSPAEEGEIRRVNDDIEAYINGAVRSLVKHGDQAGGTLHPVVTSSVNGFMSAADKDILDGLGSSEDSHGELYEDDDEGTNALVISTGGDVEKWTTSTAGDVKGSTYVTVNTTLDRIVIGADGEGLYTISAHAALASSGNALVSMILQKNGGDPGKALKTSDEKSSGQHLDLDFSGHLYLVEGDYLDLHFSADVTNTTLTLYQINLSIFRIPSGATAGGGSGDTYAETVSSWTESGDFYYADVTHNLATKDVAVAAYTTADDKTVGLHDIDRTSTNIVRVWVASEEDIRILVMPSAGAGGGGGGDLSGIKWFYADQFDVANNSDWAVNAPAPIVADPDNVALVICRLDDTDEEGPGIRIPIPSSATSLKLHKKYRAITAPGGVRTAGFKLYARGFPHNTDRESWDSGLQLTDGSLPTNAYPQEDDETNTLATLGYTAGRDYQFQITRVAPSAGTNLTGDLGLIAIGLEFV